MSLATKLVNKKILIIFSIFVILSSLLIAKAILLRSGNKMLSLGIPEKFVPTSIDPANISNLNKAIFCDNLYARLVLFNEGQILPWLAKSFLVEGNSIKFNLDGARASDGSLITSVDVKNSLKRLIILNTNTHAKLQQFIDCEDPIDDCDSIETPDMSTIVFRLKKLKYTFTFLKILSSTEYGIVPTKSLNERYKIHDYSITTGAFYLKDSTLIKNAYFKTEDSYADAINIVGATSSKNVLDAFYKGNIDIIPTTVNLSEDSISILNQKNISYSLFKTEKIKLFVAVFGPLALTNFNSDERLFYSKILRENLFRDYSKPLDSDLTDSFFHNLRTNFSNTDLLKQDITVQTDKKLNFTTYNGLEASTVGLEKSNLIRVHYTDDFPLEKNFKQRPESFFMMTDVGFDDDFTLFSYILNNDLIFITESQKNTILESILEDSEAKSEIINAFKNKVYQESLIAPLFKAPYTILTRGGLNSSQSKLSASTKLWLIK